eukprot:10716_1
MYRINQPLRTLIRHTTSSNILSKQSIIFPSLTSIRSSTGGTKGAPPISIDDLYGLCFLAEPSIKPPIERTPKDMFDCDLRLNEVVVYLNGGLHASKDKVSEDFGRHMFEASVIFFPRDASNKPDEFKDILKREGGTDELPQLWIQGKLVGSGNELKDFDRVWELCTPARRPWPRDGSYSKGFYNAPGVTSADKVIGAGV